MHSVNSYDQEATTTEFGSLGVSLFFLFFPSYMFFYLVVLDSTYSAQDIALRTRVALLHLEYSLLLRSGKNPQKY